MNYTAKEVIQFVEEEDVKFIRLAFCDIYGTQKNISIMPTELRRAFESGISIDASEIAGFGGDSQTDLFLHPDPDTLSILPWRPEHGRVVRMLCNITYPDGTVFEGDTRAILQKAIQKAKAMGLSFSFGSELEFYLFQLDENGKRTSTPFDQAGYMDIAPADKGENIRREICLTLERMGIQPESSHHESGPGQNEIDFRYSDALAAADHAVTFRMVVQTVASRNGAFADFSPKPMENHPGNGFYINMSVKSEDGDEQMEFMTAGIITHISEITAFLNPSDSSYLRLGHGKAPKYITWSPKGRLHLIRVPAIDGEHRRIELRSPDPEANPYLAFAFLIYAAVDGIQKHSSLCAPSDLPESQLKTSHCPALPETLANAKSVARNSLFVQELIPEELLHILCE